MLGASDEEHLAFALAEGRVIFTLDADFLRLAAAGHEHAGIAYARLRNIRGRHYSRIDVDRSSSRCRGDER